VEARLRSLGFGLERLGLLVLRAPRLFALAALALTIAGASTLPQTSFDGRLVDILSDNQSFQPMPRSRTASETPRTMPSS